MYYVLCSGSTTSCPDEFVKLLTILAAKSATCGTFPFKQLELLHQLLTSESEYVTNQHDLLQKLQKHIPVLFKLITELGNFPQYLKGILQEVICKVEYPFLRNSHPRFPTRQEDILAFYPNLPKKYQRGTFTMDKTKSTQICSKRGTRHPSLLPGIFTVFCEHGMLTHHKIAYVVKVQYFVIY